MSKFSFLFVFLLFANNSTSQQNSVLVEQDFALAKVGFKIHGVYVFMLADPYFEYDFIATVKIKINWTKSLRQSFDKLIKKSKKKYTNFNGIIIQANDLSKADLIRFNGLNVARSGFTIGDKVSFIENGTYFVGEVVQLGKERKISTEKNSFSIKYVNSQGDEIIKKIDPSKLTPISDDSYNASKNEVKINSTNEINDNQINIGDNVIWTDGTNRTGEVINIIDDTAKVKLIGALGIIKTVKLTSIKKISAN